MAEQPPDLVAVREAAPLVDRSLSTLRAWVRAGEIPGYREEPGNGRSRLMVSRAELLAYAAACKVPDPPRRVSGTADDVLRVGAVAAATVRAELEGRASLEAALRATVAALEGRCDDLAARAVEGSALRAELVAVERRRADEWRERTERLEVELVGTRAELAALRLAQDLPWWRRLIGGPPPALVEG